MNGARRCLALFTVCARIAVPAHKRTSSAVSSISSSRRHRAKAGEACVRALRCLPRRALGEQGRSRTSAITRRAASTRTRTERPAADCSGSSAPAAVAQPHADIREGTDGTRTRRTEPQRHPPGGEAAWLVGTADRPCAATHQGHPPLARRSNLRAGLLALASLPSPLVSRVYQNTKGP